ncbi:MAG: Sulfate adenylyltransferase subunit 1, partial [Jatrophihabitantaceae bacterium]|nr:Sulfate adenylyltransferase subunit 1 [Jatrophihabitantaceae bacterium]
VTGASTADVAVILVDARTGVVDQTRRHAAVAALLRVAHIVLAVNKMDLVDFDEPVFDRIVTDFTSVASSLGLPGFTPIPLAALTGDNVVERSIRMPWYSGPPLLRFLEDVEAREGSDIPARFPVQVVMRPRSAEYPDYRGYGGKVEAGTLRVGDAVTVLPSGRTTSIEGIDTADGALDWAGAGRSVVVRLADNIDLSRGDVIVGAGDPRPVVARQITATLCWLSDRPLRPNDRFLLRHTTRSVRAVVDDIVGRLDITTVTSAVTDVLELNDIGTVRLRIAEPIIADPYALNRSTGALLLVDEASGATMAAGMVVEASA